MSIPVSHELITELKRQQVELANRVSISPLEGEIKLIAGCDCALADQQVVTVFVVFDYPSLTEIEVQVAAVPLELPYIPGLLAFREIPALQAAYAKLQHIPDLIMVDGNGFAHPRRLGIASHLGVLLDRPTIGIAKKKLVGQYEQVELAVGEYVPLIDHGQQVGWVLRTSAKSNPIFISPGHLCSFSDALAVVQQTLQGYKLPKPTQVADKYSKQLKNSLV